MLGRVGGRGYRGWEREVREGGKGEVREGGWEMLGRVRGRG